MVAEQVAGRVLVRTSIFHAIILHDAKTDTLKTLSRLLVLGSVTFVTNVVMSGKELLSMCSRNSVRLSSLVGQIARPYHACQTSVNYGDRTLNSYRWPGMSFFLSAGEQNNS